MLALLGCGEDREHPDDPPLAVPGMEVTPPPPPGHPSAGQLAMAAPPTFDPPLAVPGQPTPIPPPPPPPMPAGMQPGQAPPGMPPGQAPPGMQPEQAPAMEPATAQMMTLAPGFVPDPAIARGMALGQMPASSLDPSCTGLVPSQPSHVITLSGAFQDLRVLVSSTADTVLVIRQPDGSFRCNDDTELGVNPNPTVQGAFAPGAYTIWVGTYSEAPQPVPYVIGFTELAHVTHASLGG